MDTQLIKQILDADFYNSNKDKLSKNLFEDEILELYDVIKDAHSKYNSNLTTEALFNLWQDANPVATKANIDSMKGVIGKIESLDLLDRDIASDLLAGLWRRDMGRRIARLGLALSEGKADAFSRLEKLVDDHRNGFMPTDFGDETTKDLETLLELTSDDNKFQFNIPSLSKKVFGIGRGDFGILFARPETGKTALSVSLLFGPGGYVDQGLKVAYLGNEEATEKTMLRAYQAWTGMTKPEIIAAPQLAMERFELIADKVSMMNIMGWTVDQVDAYVAHVEADVVLVDQFDKVTIPGNYDAPHLKLRELYTQGREIPKRRNCAMWAVSQASNDAENKTVLTPAMMEGSKTGKFAEADIIIGVGKYPDNEDGTDDPIRFLTVGKNKISGWHGTMAVKLEKEISRYVD